MQSSSSIDERRGSFNSWRAEPRSPWGECVSSPILACRARGCDAALARFNGYGTCGRQLRLASPNLQSRRLLAPGRSGVASLFIGPSPKHFATTIRPRRIVAAAGR